MTCSGSRLWVCGCEDPKSKEARRRAPGLDHLPSGLGPAWPAAQGAEEAGAALAAAAMAEDEAIADEAEAALAEAEAVAAAS